LKARKCRKVLDFLYTAFPTKTPELERFNLISLYGMASQLLESYVVKDRVAALSEWFIAFESYRRAQEERWRENGIRKGIQFGCGGGATDADAAPPIVPTSVTTEIISENCLILGGRGMFSTAIPKAGIPVISIASFFMETTTPWSIS
jgi:hypothetical protein